MQYHLDQFDLYRRALSRGSQAALMHHAVNSLVGLFIARSLQTQHWTLELGLHWGKLMKRYKTSRSLRNCNVKNIVNLCEDIQMIWCPMIIHRDSVIRIFVGMLTIGTHRYEVSFVIWVSGIFVLPRWSDIWQYRVKCIYLIYIVNQSHAFNMNDLT